MELSMVERKTPTATTKKTLQRFCFDREDKIRTEYEKTEYSGKIIKNECLSIVILRDLITSLQEESS